VPSTAKKIKERPNNSTQALSHLSSVSDRMHALLVARADELMGCTENSPEEAELAALTDVIESYERQRWPLGKIPGGKG
jgi:DNA-binding ferritin-like protein